MYAHAHNRDTGKEADYETDTEGGESLSSTTAQVVGMSRRSAPHRSSGSIELPLFMSQEGVQNIDYDGDKRKASSLKRGKWLLLLAIVALLLILINWYMLLAATTARREQEIQEQYLFSVAINTYNRPRMLIRALDHYLQCKYVSDVHIVWSESDKVPTRLFERYRNTKAVFDVHTEDSLNNRFKPLSQPHKDAVFSVDDDMRVSCDELRLAHEVWRFNSQALVGFIPRIHVRSNSGNYVYRCWWRVWWYGAYSIILTKAAFLSHKYFEMYSDVMPQEIRHLVDAKGNCEDIAMQFLIANHTRQGPVYIKGHLTDLGVLGGISTSKNVVKAGHMDERSQCLNDLANLFRGMPLVESTHIVYAASNGWVNRPSTLYEYISSDLWNFDALE